MTYKLKSLSLQHGWPTKVMLLRDGANRPTHKAELEAQIASCDYFSTLATRLDEISSSLKKTHKNDYLVLENTIEDLLFLQEYYGIYRKTG